MPQITMEQICGVVEKLIRYKQSGKEIDVTFLQKIIQANLSSSLGQQIQNNTYAQGDEDGILSMSLSYMEPTSQTPLSVAAGYQDPLRGTKKEVDTNTLYNTGSMAKFILMVLILRLIQDKKLAFDTLINAHLEEKEIPPMDGITVAHLLGHRSGLKDSAFIDFKEQDALNKLIKKTALGGWDLAGKPGDNFYYANVNFLLLAKLIQIVCKQRLAACVEELINKPLGISAIKVIGCDEPHLEYAAGYQPNTQGTSLVDGSDHFIFGATGFRATPSSLIQLMAAFFQNDGFICSELRQRILCSMKNETFEVITPNHTYRWPVTIGLGLEERTIVLNDQSIRIYCHGGWQNSHAGFLAYDPQTKTMYACCVAKTHGLANIHQKQIKTRLNQIDPTALPIFGLGCVNLTAENGNIIEYALQSGITSFDTADCYGNGESERTLGQKLQAARRENIFISSKCGVQFMQDGIHISDGPEYIATACAASLQRLQTTYIDLYYLHRVDPKVALEESMVALKSLVQQGKIKYIGLSEVTANQIRRAHKIHPIKAVQIEYAPWSREDEANGVIKTCQELGISTVAYSPLGRGFFTTAEASFFLSLPKGDFRTFLPRYSGENLKSNIQVRTKLSEVASAKGCSLAQLILAWEIKKGMVVIPATTQPKHLDENLTALLIKLEEKEMEQIEHILKNFLFQGPRYPSQAFSAIYKESSSNSLLFGGGFLAAAGLFAYNYYSKKPTKKATEAPFPLPKPAESQIFIRSKL
jgi:aryl-alcohol dehydrogenase-like predicted oxidoreductase